jgi:hypothetical protein
MRAFVASVRGWRDDQSCVLDQQKDLALFGLTPEIAREKFCAAAERRP